MEGCKPQSRGCGNVSVENIAKNCKRSRLMRTGGITDEFKKPLTNQPYFLLKDLTSLKQVFACDHFLIFC